MSETSPSHTKHFLSADIWYVNADGMEGWVPSDVLRMMQEDEFQSSGQSTPVDALSAEVSADNSEMSDDGESPAQDSVQIQWIPLGPSRSLEKWPLLRGGFVLQSSLMFQE